MKIAKVADPLAFPDELCPGAAALVPARGSELPPLQLAKSAQATIADKPRPIEFPYGVGVGVGGPGAPSMPKHTFAVGVGVGTGVGVGVGVGEDFAAGDGVGDGVAAGGADGEDDGPGDMEALPLGPGDGEAPGEADASAVAGNGSEPVPPPPPPPHATKERVRSAKSASRADLMGGQHINSPRAKRLPNREALRAKGPNEKMELNRNVHASRRAVSKGRQALRCARERCRGENPRFRFPLRLLPT